MRFFLARQGTSSRRDEQNSSSAAGTGTGWVLLLRLRAGLAVVISSDAVDAPVSVLHAIA